MDSILLYFTVAVVLITCIVVIACFIVICVRLMRLQSEDSTDSVTMVPWLIASYIFTILVAVELFIFVCWLTYKQYRYIAVPCSVENYNSSSSMNELFMSTSGNINQVRPSLFLQPTEPLVKVEQVVVQQGPGSITLHTKPDECCEPKPTELTSQIITGRVY